MTANRLRILVPSPEDVRDLGDGCYAAPVLLDDVEWASFSPCHIAPIVRARAEFEVLGQITDYCQADGCKQLWEVRWDPWRIGAKGFALWIE